MAVNNDGCRAGSCQKEKFAASVTEKVWAKD